VEFSLNLFKVLFQPRPKSEKKTIIQIIDEVKQDEKLKDAIRKNMEKKVPKDKRSIIDDFKEFEITKLVVYSNGDLKCFIKNLNQLPVTYEVDLTQAEYFALQNFAKD